MRFMSRKLQNNAMYFKAHRISLWCYISLNTMTIVLVHWHNNILFNVDLCLKSGLLSTRLIVLDSRPFVPPVCQIDYNSAIRVIRAYSYI